MSEINLHAVSRDVFVSYLETAVKAYQAGQPVLTDKEYDEAETLFSSRFPGDLYLSDVRDSVDENSRWEKMEHEYPVVGLSKCQTQDDIEAWLSHNPGPYVVQEKLDGISIEMVYEGGKLTKAITRGKNNIGENIVRNVRKMKGVPATIALKDKLHVRGEIFLFAKDFNELVSKGIELVNPRNAAAGIAKRFDGTNSEYLTVVSYAILNHEELGLTTESEVVFNLAKHGFKYLYGYGCRDMEEINSLYNEYVSNKRANLGYDIDGLVIKTEKLQPMKKGKESPDNQTAWKFPHQSSRTTVKGFLHSVEGSKITPVAILEPVFVAGVTISKATLHNYPLAIQSGIGVGSEVEITRRNDVIPKVEQVFTPGKEPLSVPEKCPVCNGEVGYETNVNGETLQFFECKNPGCPAKAVRQIEKWLAACNTKGIGPEIVRQLHDAKIAPSLPEFLMLSYGTSDSDILALPGMERKKLEMIKREIDKTLDIPLITFLKAMDFPGIGERMLEKFLENQARLCFGGEICPVNKITLAHFIDFYGVGDQNPFQDAGELTMKTLKLDILQKRKYMETLQKYVSIKAYIKENTSHALSGKSFCFTGELVSMGRDVATAKVKEQGGEVKSSVNSKLTYLVTNDPNSGTTKNKKARELGVSVISEAEFLALIGSEVPAEKSEKKDEVPISPSMVENSIFDL